MASKKTPLQIRAEKASAIVYAGLTRVQGYTQDRKIKTVLVPGSDAKRYQVILRRPKNGIITTECRVEASSNGYVDCKGNSNGSLCYHSLAAIETAAREAHRRVAFCSTYQAAKKVAQLHSGKIGYLDSHQGHGTLVLVTYDRRQR